MKLNSLRPTGWITQVPGPHLKEGKVLILVDLNCKNRVPRRLSETTQTHLGIEEVHHGLLQTTDKGGGVKVRWISCQQSGQFCQLSAEIHHVGAAHLCNPKRDVAHIESAGLSGHLAPHHRYGGGGHRQAVWSHGGKEGCGRDLACGWRQNSHH